MLLHKQFAHTHVKHLTGVHSCYHLPPNLQPSCPCCTCMMTQQAEKPCSSKQMHDSVPCTMSKLDQVNIDLHGPYPEESFRQYQYVAVFVDSCTCHLHVTPIQSKSDTLDALQEYIQCVSKPCMLTHNCGTEFTGTFADFCCTVTNAINVLRTEGYTPWCNR